MKKTGIAKRWAHQSGLSEGEAADRLDAAVRQILARLRQSGEAPLPGLGRFRRAAGGKVRFEREGGPGNA